MYGGCSPSCIQVESASAKCQHGSIGSSVYFICHCCHRLPHLPLPPPLVAPWTRSFRVTFSTDNGLLVWLFRCFMSSI